MTITDRLTLGAVLFSAAVLFGTMLFNPGQNHKTSTTQDANGAVVTKSINWEMMNVNR